MSKNLVELVEKYRKLQEQCGPFRFGLSAKEITQHDKSLIWSLTELDDGEFGKTILVNEIRGEDEVFDYALATKHSLTPATPDYVIEVVWFLCEVCGGGELGDPDSCTECQGNGTVFVDIEEASNKLGTNLSEETIWATRQCE